MPHAAEKITRIVWMCIPTEKCLIYHRESLSSLVLNPPVITNVVRPPPVNMAARVVKCVTSAKEDSTAHAQQDTRDTGVTSCCLLDHVKTSWSSKKRKPMESTTLCTNRTSHSQSTATLIPSLVPHGLWSSLTLFKITRRFRTKPSSITTCQPTKMHLNGTTTVCQRPLWSPFKMSPLTGEPLVIFPQLAWTTDITGEYQWKVCICLWSHPQIYSAFFPSLSTSVEICVLTARFGLRTVQFTALLFKLTAGIAQKWVVILMESLGE